MSGPSRPPTPWLAVEYVHGGVEGTTLEERVKGSIERTGVAFDSARAAHALKCLAAGLHAIHGVGVVHRDLTPGNVLCCGFGEAEILKISDFGIARPQGLAATFGAIPVGTLGYAAPEQCLPDSTGTGTFTDIFALACVLYFTLTGETLFDSDTLIKNMLAIRDTKRRSLLDCQALVPELRQRADACRAIDVAIARATSLDASQRPQEALEFAASVVPWLTETPTPPKPSRRFINSLINLSPPGDLTRWEWTVRHPGGERIIQSAAWDVDGHCLAFTTEGPAFWNGQTWVSTPEIARNLPPGMGFARRIEAGGWLIGGAGGQLVVYASDGVREVVRAPHTDVTFTHANGRFDDLLAAVSQRPGEPPSLWAMAARRWMKPMPLEGVAVRRRAPAPRRFALVDLRPAHPGQRLCRHLFADAVGGKLPASAAHARLRGRRVRGRPRPRPDRGQPRRRAARRRADSGGLRRREQPGSDRRRDGRLGSRMGREPGPAVGARSGAERRLAQRLDGSQLAGAVRQHHGRRRHARRHERGRRDFGGPRELALLRPKSRLVVQNATSRFAFPTPTC